MCVCFLLNKFVISELTVKLAQHTAEIKYDFNRQSDMRRTKLTRSSRIRETQRLRSIHPRSLIKMGASVKGNRYTSKKND